MSLNQFLQLLENRVDHNAVAAIWHKVVQEAALKHFLQPTNDLATSYPDSKTGQILTVVRHPDGSIFAVNEDNPNIRKPLTQAEIVLYSPDWQNLRKQLAAALSLKTSRVPIPGRVGILHLGNWEPKKAAMFPVCMVVARSSSNLHKRILPLVNASKKEGVLLLTPTRRHWKEDITQIAHSHKMLFVAMEEVLEIQGDRLKSTKAWTEYLNGFCQMVKIQLPGNYQNKKPMPVRARKTANIEKIEKALDAHLLSARDHAHSLVQRGKSAELLPRPEQKMLAKQIGLSESAVSRCLNDERAKVLKILWETAINLELVMKYKKRR